MDLSRPVIRNSRFTTLVCNRLLRSPCFSLRLATGLAVPARGGLAAVELTARCERVGDGSEVRRHKPAPDLFLRAATRLHVEPAHCVVIEDAAAGIEAARAAGMRCVGVGDVRTLRAASLVVHSLADLTAEFLIDAMREAPVPPAEHGRGPQMQRGCDACESGPTAV